MKFVHFCGQFHPALTHFPVALLLIAALAESIHWANRRSIFHIIAAFNLVVGAVASPVVAALGWALAATMGMEPELRPMLAWHRWLGTATAVWALVTVFLWWRNRSAPAVSPYLNLYRIALWGGAVLIAITGHLGGLLVYGLDYFSWPTS